MCLWWRRATDKGVGGAGWSRHAGSIVEREGAAAVAPLLQPPPRMLVPTHQGVWRGGRAPAATGTVKEMESGPRRIHRRRGIRAGGARRRRCRPRRGKGVRWPRKEVVVESARA